MLLVVLLVVVFRVQTETASKEFADPQVTACQHISGVPALGGGQIPRILSIRNCLQFVGMCLWDLA